MWFPVNDYSRRKCPKSSHRYATQSTVVLVFGPHQTCDRATSSPTLAQLCRPVASQPCNQEPSCGKKDCILHAHLQVMFLYLSLHSCPRNWWSTWLQAVGRWCVVWSATMAMNACIRSASVFCFRKTWDIPTSHPLFLRMVLGSQLTFGQESLEFFTPDEATWCGGMPNTWRSQCHISWPLGGVGLTWSLYITLKGRLSDHMGFVSSKSLSCPFFRPSFCSYMWTLSVIYWSHVSAPQGLCTLHHGSLFEQSSYWAEIQDSGWLFSAVWNGGEFFWLQINLICGTQVEKTSVGGCNLMKIQDPLWFAHYRFFFFFSWRK